MKVRNNWFVLWYDSIILKLTNFCNRHWSLKSVAFITSLDLIKAMGFMLSSWSNLQLASFFYSMHRALRLKKALRATVTQQKFVDLKLNARCGNAVSDVENPEYWTTVYCYCTACFLPCNCWDDRWLIIMSLERMEWLSGIAELSSESLPGFKPLGFKPQDVNEGKMGWS